MYAWRAEGKRIGGEVVMKCEQSILSIAVVVMVVIVFKVMMVCKWRWWWRR